MALKSDHVNSLYACSPRYKHECNKHYWFRKPDGKCNNLPYPWWGAAFTPYKRLDKPAYEDKVKEPRKFSVLGQPLKSPRFIASVVHFSKDKYDTISHYLPIFGQYLMHDMARTGHSYGEDGQLKACPCDSDSSTCINVEIPKGDEIGATQDCLVQVRERDSRNDFECDLGYRQQVNEATAWIDQSSTYGNDEEQEKKLRSFKGGRLRVARIKGDKLEKNTFMPNKCDANRDFKLLVQAGVCFQTGDHRANENPLLAGVHTIFLREHNNLVDALHSLNAAWNDQRLFLEGRRIMNAIYQHIVYAEWLPAVLGDFFYKSFGLSPLTYNQNSSEYSQGYFVKYDPYIMPNLATEFVTAAGRFGHALIRSKLSKANRKLSVTESVSLSESLFRPILLAQDYGKGFNNLMRGCLRDLGNNNQPSITKDLLDYLVVDHGNNNPSHYHSLPTININRGRDVALQSYNKYRLYAGLNYANSFEELTGIEPDKIASLKHAYAHVNDIELFPGGMSETQVPGGLVGPTFACESKSLVISRFHK